jgi:hypothetical protein
MCTLKSSLFIDYGQHFPLHAINAYIMILHNAYTREETWFWSINANEVVINKNNLYGIIEFLHN